MPYPLEIRRANKADVESVFEIEAAVQKAPWEKRAFTDMQGDEDLYFFVAVDNASRPVAFIIGMHTDDFLEILNFAVTPDFQGQGIGSWLFEYALHEAAVAGIESVRLEVREGNVPAIALYKAHGLETVGMRRGYYSDNGENALLMSGLISSV